MVQPEVYDATGEGADWTGSERAARSVPDFFFADSVLLFIECEVSEGRGEEFCVGGGVVIECYGAGEELRVAEAEWMGFRRCVCVFAGAHEVEESNPQDV